MIARTSPPARRWDLPFVVFVVLLGLLPRWYVLHLTNFGIESDEAIIGLMAKHITEGRPWPVFYYGQSYMGSLEAIFTALSFELFGRSNMALKLVPLTFSLVHIVLVYCLAQMLAGRFAARIASFFTALAPSALIIWSTKARGGFIELVVLGDIALLLAGWMLARGLHRVRVGETFLLGLILGVGWWVNNQIIFYIAAIVALFSAVLLFRRAFDLFGKLLLSGTVGFFIGGAPFWYANLAETPKFQSFAVLAGSVGWRRAIVQFIGFVTDALPILFGAKRLWQSGSEVFPGATFLAYVIYAAIFGAVLWMVLKPSAKSASGVQSRSALVLCLLFCLLMPVIFSKSERGWLVQEPRYLLPLYSVLFVFVGMVISSLRARPLLAAIPFVSVLSLNLASNYLGEVALPGEPFLFDGERVARDHRELYSYLREKGIRHLHANYWLGYRIAFETDESIKFSVFHGDRVVRIREYETDAPKDLKLHAFVLPSKEAPVVEQQLHAQGFAFEAATVNSYVVISDLRPVVSVGGEIPLSSNQIEVTSRSDWAPRMVDNNLDSRWGSGAPQAPGMAVEVHFAQPRAIAAVAITTGSWPQDEARGMRIEGIHADGSKSILGAISGEAVVTPAMYPLKGVEWGESASRGTLFVFQPENVKALRLVLQGSDPVFDWSIAELKVFSPEK